MHLIFSDIMEKLQCAVYRYTAGRIIIYRPRPCDTVRPSRDTQIDRLLLTLSHSRSHCLAPIALDYRLRKRDLQRRPASRDHTLRRCKYGRRYVCGIDIGASRIPVTVT